jgi:hypothetical protein
MKRSLIRDIRLYGFIVPERNSNGDFYSVIAWCPECHAWHTHWGDKAEPPEGVQLHRVPHCTNENFRNRNLYDGYVIEIAGRATPEVMADFRRNRPRGLKPSWRQGENPIADQAA